MSYWKFICTWRTEKECLIRRLVGNDKKVDSEGESLDVEEGDTVFLHRTINAEKQRGYIIGPFKATSPAQESIVPNAWSYLSEFPWQVRIDWDSTVYSFDIEEVGDSCPIEFTAHAQALNEVQGLYLEGKVKDGQPVISPP